MTRGIATHLLAGGNGVTLRGTEHAEDLAAQFRDQESAGEAKIEAGLSGDQIGGEVVVLAVPYNAAAPVVQQYDDALAGKVVGITNPVDWQIFDGLVTPPESSAAEEISKAAPRTRGS